MEWMVYVETRAPEGAGPLDPDDERFDRFEEALEERRAGNLGGGGADRWSATVTIDDSVCKLAAIDGELVARAAAKAAGLPDWPTVRLEVTLADVVDEDQARSNFPDLVGASAVAEILGVSRQRLAELRATDRFPLPVTTIDGRDVWMRAAIEKFDAGWERRPGRPRREDVAPIRPGGLGASSFRIGGRVPVRGGHD